MKQVLITRSGVRVEDVPEPAIEPGTILVRTHRSCISVGTEMAGVQATGQPLLQRLRQRPDQVKQVIDLLRKEGFTRTRRLVEWKLKSAFPTGYSAVGEVIAVGEDILDLRIGDRVACAGAQYAFHAEVIRVPRNLVIPVPASVHDASAATVTLGAIALQGVRRAAPTIGETFIVIGLGLIGQLTVQLLKANGAHVIGADLRPERVEIALGFGMDAGLAADGDEALLRTAQLTGGHGADGVIITASTHSNDVTSTAFRMCRRKARVVLVGSVGLDLKRDDIYAKELDFLISTSYGPGRYDRHYEEEGLDYPLGYVRWTENRNMAAYLDLLAEGRVRVDGLVAASYPLEAAAEAFGVLQAANSPLAVTLSYPLKGRPEGRRLANPAARPAHAGALRLAVIGTGGFAQGTLLPILAAHPNRFTLSAIVSRDGHNAVETAERFGAERAATDAAETIADPAIDAVVIATRHDSHGQLVLDALVAGKHVFVEKPLCLTQSELDAIERFFAKAPGERLPVMQAGFNRRFSDCAGALKKLLDGRVNPMILNYRVNAGYIPTDHWVHGPAGGGRNRGEACHFYDLFTYLTGAAVRNVFAVSVHPATEHCRTDDNFVATATFEDGSVATLTYTAMGHAAHPKELLDVYCDGKIARIDDFRALEVDGSSGTTAAPGKGHEAELLAFSDAIRSGGAWPIPLWQQIQATAMALAVEKHFAGAARPRGEH